jgi:hypothetical protein
MAIFAEARKQSGYVGTDWLAHPGGRVRRLPIA